MSTPETVKSATFQPLDSKTGDDYAVIRRAIRFLTNNVGQQPDLAALAHHLGLSSTHTQKLFKRWCGLSPKAFIEALTLDHARYLLRNSASVLETAHTVGLSGGSRLHDLFLSHEAMTPGEFKRGGAGLELSYGFHRTPFGEALTVNSARGLCGMGFVNEDAGQTRGHALDDFAKRWPLADFARSDDAGQTYINQIFEAPNARPRCANDMRIVLMGTDFEVSVWQSLLRIPDGHAVTYGDIARHLGKPKASRAVGSAVGRNPISFVVPCHRVLRSGGGLGGYHWGLTRKHAIIGWEKGRLLGR